MNNIQSQLRYGLIAGCILIIIKYLLVVSIPGISIKSFVLDYLATFTLLAVVSYIAVTAQRNLNGGTTSFKEVFFICIFISFVTALMAGGFQYLYAKYMDPGRADRMVQATIDYMKHTTQSEANQKIAVENARVFYSPGSQFQAGMSSLVVGLFISLIIALVAKKDVRNSKTEEDN
jgi:hypothetical protein